jgi:mannose-6-phosphate isomerase-like protein (cupin superfamily)
MKEVAKGWGFERWVVNKPEYCGKLLHFNKGGKCSFHYHEQKDETFYVHSGKLLVKYGYSEDINLASEITLSAGDSFYVPPRLIHQMIALEDTDMFEFSTEHFEEDSFRVSPGDSQKTIQ